MILHGRQPASFSSAFALLGLCSVLDGIAVIGRAGRHGGVVLDRRAAEQFDELAAVQCVVGGAADADIGHRPAYEVQDVRPVVRIDVGDDLHAGALQSRYGIRRRRLDEIHLAGEQRRGARCRLRHRQQHQSVILGDALGVPVLLVRHQLEAFVRHEAVGAERPGARWVLGVGVPVVVQRLGAAAAYHQQVAHLVRKQRFHDLGGDRHRVVVDLLHRREVRRVGTRERHLLRVVLRRLLVGDAAEVPQHIVRRERTAVVPLHALAQLVDPAAMVVGIDLPLGGEARLDVRGLVTAREVPQRQPVVEVVADEAEPLEPLIRISRGRWNVAGRHGDGHHRFGVRMGR